MTGISLIKHEATKKSVSSAHVTSFCTNYEHVHTLYAPSINVREEEEEEEVGSRGACVY